MRFIILFLKNIFSSNVTENQNPAWYPAEANNRLIINFTLWFSRFEYALKNTQGFSRINSFGELAPDWVALQNHLQNTQVPAMLADAINFLQANPPRRQLGEGNWQPIQVDQGWPFLIRSMKTVRNNFFHGGKQIQGEFLSPIRDITLLNHSMSIMRELLNIVPQGIRDAFNG
jgi:hypothetical protein